VERHPSGVSWREIAECTHRNQICIAKSASRTRSAFLANLRFANCTGVDGDKPVCEDSSRLNFSDSSASNTALQDFPTKERFMYNAIPLILAALIAVGIIVIGCFYLVSPERISGTFGLKPPASDADTRAWLRPKGIRDVAAGLLVLTMMLTADTRLVGIALLVEAVIPFGDMSIILGSGGSKSRAFSIHGVTCAVMFVVGLLLIHAI
jgi:hypothetical protein